MARMPDLIRNCSFRLLSACAFLLASAYAGDLRFASGLSSRTIPFRLEQGHIYVQLRINDSRSLWFLVDTGASHNVVDLRIAKELGLHTRRIDNVDRAIGTQGPAAYLITTAVAFHFPGAVLTDGTTVAMSLEQTSACLAEIDKDGTPMRRSPYDVESRSNLAGIVGKTLFDAGVVEINYPRRVLRFYSSENVRRQASGVSIPIEVESELLFLRASVKSMDNPSATARLVVDTGAATALSLTKQFGQRNKVMPAVSQLTPGTECGAAGKASEPTLIGVIERVGFGPVEVLNPRTVFYEQTDSRWYDGLLGNDAFRGFKVTIDLSHLRMTLERAK